MVLIFISSAWNIPRYAQLDLVWEMCKLIRSKFLNEIKTVFESVVAVAF